MKRILLHLLLLIVVESSCDSTEQSRESSTGAKNAPITNSVENNDSVPAPIKHISAPVDLVKLKKLPFLETTSGIASGSESANLCRPPDDGFFGCYYLLNRTEYMNPEPFGSLIVFFKGKADKWFYENNNEAFAQITLTSSQISVWDSIHVGMKEEKVLRFIDTAFHYKKGTLLYAEIYGYSSEFRINADTVEQIKISKKCGARHEK